MSHSQLLMAAPPTIAKMISSTIKSQSNGMVSPPSPVGFRSSRFRALSNAEPNPKKRLRRNDVDTRRRPDAGSWNTAFVVGLRPAAAHVHEGDQAVLPDERVPRLRASADGLGHRDRDVQESERRLLLDRNHGCDGLLHAEPRDREVREHQPRARSAGGHRERLS